MKYNEAKYIYTIIETYMEITSKLMEESPIYTDEDVEQQGNLQKIIKRKVKEIIKNELQGANRKIKRRIDLQENSSKN